MRRDGPWIRGRRGVPCLIVCDNFLVWYLVGHGTGYLVEAQERLRWAGLGVLISGVLIVMSTCPEFYCTGTRWQLRITYSNRHTSI